MYHDYRCLCAAFSVCNVLSLSLTSVLLGNGLSKRCITDTADTTSSSSSSSTSNKPPLLHYDSRSQSVVTSAKAGYLHFYHMVSLNNYGGKHLVSL